jgi:hypothetical protein
VFRHFRFQGLLEYPSGQLFYQAALPHNLFLGKLSEIDIIKQSVDKILFLPLSCHDHVLSFGIFIMSWSFTQFSG